RWLDESADHRALAAHWLAADGAIDLPVEVLVECLLLPEGDRRTTRLRFHGDGEVNFPWLSDGRWFLHQFRRWGWLSPDAMGDDARLAELHRLDSYRLAALQAGVPVRIVNGVSAAFAAAASLGVSLTHREHCHGVTFVTAH